MQQFKLQSDRFQLDLGTETCIMGILNTTPDSFSDGGKYNNLDAAVEHGIQLAEAGAHIIDIGGESSRPFAEPVSEQEELDRVVPVIERLSREIDLPISIDTVKARVAEEGLAAGAHIINDISALEKDPEMVNVAVSTQAPVILMHMKGTPQNMQVNPDYQDLMLEITRYLQLRVAFAMDAGIEKRNIILDPGIGFGKTVLHNLTIINHIEKLTALGFPLLIGPSRKSFIQNILSEKENTPIDSGHIKAEYGTMASVAASIFKGAHIVRVHDVEKVKPFTRIIDSIRNA